MAIAAAYPIFVVAAALCFWRLPVRDAILAVFLGGWLLLPVGRYPPVVAGIFPWWITGLAVPSDMLVTKAWIAPVVALAGALAVDRAAVRRLRLGGIDAAMIAWCVWPIISGLAAPRPAPNPIVAALYVTGCWGVPWLIGRVWFADRAGWLVLARGLAVAGLACVPIAIVEGVASPVLYEFVYATHPFRTDGMIRYIGYRPIGLFEHGNQYGIWTALSALAAAGVAVARRDARDAPAWLGIAALTVLLALASQSVGAILLLLIGLGVMGLWRLPVIKPALVAAALLVATVGVVHVSGILPVQRIARDTAVGRRAIDMFRIVGRGSFAWRISQDTKTLGAVRDRPLAGSGRWDWFRPFGTRPWGLALLLAGQFGLVGLALSFGSIAAAATVALARAAEQRGRRDAVVLPLGLIVLLALADGLLNSFFYFPAVLAAGAIACRPAVAGGRAGADQSASASAIRRRELARP